MKGVQVKVKVDGKVIGYLSEPRQCVCMDCGRRFATGEDFLTHRTGDPRRCMAWQEIGAVMRVKSGSYVRVDASHPSAKAYNAYLADQRRPHLRIEAGDRFTGVEGLREGPGWLYPGLTRE